MIVFNQLAMAYGYKLLFTDVTLKLDTNKRYALTGANGAGKSTLLRLITGEESPLDGAIGLPKEAQVGWLKQDQFRYEETGITDVVLQGKPALWKALVQKEELLNAAEWDDKAGYTLGVLEEIIAHHHGYEANAFAEKLLTGLGIDPQYHNKTLKTLSGGYKLRVLLAQTLFQSPDILLLDEPTNHLDIVSIRWLEKYLKTEFSGLLIFISHDKKFIDSLADIILDIDYGEIHAYQTPYDKFLLEKNQLIEQQLHIKKHVEGKIASMQRFVDKFRASPSRAKQAQSRVKMIEKMELPDIKKSSRMAPHFQFSPKRPSGRQALKVVKLSKRYQDNALFQQINLEIHRGEKVALIGANGAGKSTFMKILLGKIEADEGHITWGYETSLAYFSQEHHDHLSDNISALEWLSAQCAHQSDQQIRKSLGQVLFTQDDVSKNILSLSGGEAARLLLARIMLEKSNVILLDEPTNHLDIEATDALAKALQQYTGTLILISHNRDFINKVAGRVLFLNKKLKLIDIKGNYQAFEQSGWFSDLG